MFVLALLTLTIQKAQHIKCNTILVKVKKYRKYAKTFVYLGVGCKPRKPDRNNRTIYKIRKFEVKSLRNYE